MITQSAKFRKFGFIVVPAALRFGQVAVPDYAASAARLLSVCLLFVLCN
jgi:hypothetical protein